MKLKIEVTQKGALTEGTSDLVRHAANLAQALIINGQGQPQDVTLDTPFGVASIKGGE